MPVPPPYASLNTSPVWGAEGTAVDWFVLDTAAPHEGKIMGNPPRAGYLPCTVTSLTQSEENCISTILLLCLPWKEGPPRPSTVRFKLDALLEFLKTVTQQDQPLCLLPLSRAKLLTNAVSFSVPPLWLGLGPAEEHKDCTRNRPNTTSSSTPSSPVQSLNRNFSPLHGHFCSPFTESVQSRQTQYGTVGQ